MRSPWRRRAVASVLFAALAAILVPSHPALAAEYELDSVALYEVHPAERDVDVTVGIEFTNTTPDPEGRFSVFVPDLPSVATQGETVEEALEMARDAIEGYLEIMRDEGWPVPTVRRERVAVEAA